MAKLEHMIAGAEKATGDSIITAGLFKPKGMAAREMGGAALGGAVGGAIGGDVGGAVGIGAGVLAGEAAGADQGALEYVVAVSASKVYLLKPRELREKVKHEDLVLVHTFSRDSARVSVHARVTVRILEIQDTKSGKRFEVEGPRTPLAHTEGVLHELIVSGADTEPGVEEG